MRPIDADALDMAIKALKQEPCEDCISRQAAIDALAKFVPYAICDESTESYTNGLTDAYNLICQLPSAQPDPHWIPTSKRMPEPRIDVWCNSDMGQMVGYYDEYAETWYGRDYLELMVTAWMPLPEPYKAESEGDE